MSNLEGLKEYISQNWNKVKYRPKFKFCLCVVLANMCKDLVPKELTQISIGELKKLYKERIKGE